jgi:hypothetical protein
MGPGRVEPQPPTRPHRHAFAELSGRRHWAVERNAARRKHLTVDAPQIYVNLDLWRSRVSARGRTFQRWRVSDSGAARTERPEPQRLTCIECGQVARGDASRCRAYLTVDRQIRIHCPECAVREFGED